MKEVTYGKRRKRRGKIIGVLAGILALGALVVFGLFRAREITVEGNVIYSSADIQNIIMQDGLCKNTLYFIWKYQDREKVEEELPFLSSAEVTMENPWRVKIRVYEKPEVGYFLNGTDYIYFDRDGLIVEISKKLRKDIPKITGITISKPVRYEKLPIKAKSIYVPEAETEETESEKKDKKADAEEAELSEEERAAQEIFELLVETAQTLNKNDLIPSEIKFDDKREITLYFEKMRVKLGDGAKMEDKIGALRAMFEKVKGMEGVLHMEDFTADSQTITFKQGETEETLEVETENTKTPEDGTDGADTQENGAPTESETESETPVYSEENGTFTTDDAGNPIYIDAAGNVTPNVDEYQYTDENGGIITDGYGYIDPYTGAYILK